jgi:hypothetical protein
MEGGARAGWQPSTSGQFQKGVGGAFLQAPVHPPTCALMYRIELTLHTACPAAPLFPFLDSRFRSES